MAQPKYKVKPLCIGDLLLVGNARIILTEHPTKQHLDLILKYAPQHLEEDVKEQSESKPKRTNRSSKN